MKKRTFSILFCFYFSFVNAQQQSAPDIPDPQDSSCNCFSFKPEPLEDFIVSVWVKEEKLNFQPTTPEEHLEAQPLTYTESAIKITFFDLSDVPIEGAEFEFFPSGEIIDGWQRIIGEFEVPLDAANIAVDLLNLSLDSNKLVYFDDVRIHPYNGNMKSFVYDNENYRLMAELDENNFATYYEYDYEGGLVRIKKETEKGIMTIQETRSGNTITE